MSEHIYIIILAIALHYVIEVNKDLGDYYCPQNCEVNHNHIVNEIEKEKVNNEIRKFSSRISIQRREQEEDSIRAK